jgi:Family of unknown function (DUF5709)
MSESGTYGDSVYEGGDAVEDAENLDPIENLTGDDPDEVMQTGYNPPDREPHNLRDAPTPAEEREGPSLDDRLAAEEPDVTEQSAPGTTDAGRAGRLVSPGQDALAESAEATEVAEDVGPAGYASSAEEAAVHIEGDDTGY